MKALEILHSFSDPNKSTPSKVNAIMKISRTFIQKNVSGFLKANPEDLHDALAEVQCSGQFSDDQFLGIVFAAIMVGGKNWVLLPKMLELNRVQIPILIRLQGPLESNGFSATQATWVIKNGTILTTQTLELVKYLQKNPTEDEDQCLTMSTVVDIQGKYEDFVTMFEVNFPWLS